LRVRPVALLYYWADIAMGRAGWCGWRTVLGVLAQQRRSPSKLMESGAHEDINTVEFIEARAKEIQYIEDSMAKSNKKSMLFQRMPFYKRRRSRNYDKRKQAKFTRRKKDRHFLRTHTFYAKRFFMLKLETAEDIAIPQRRRVKSSKYIYKSQERGFVFDESFRKISECETSEFLREFKMVGCEVDSDTTCGLASEVDSEISRATTCGLTSNVDSEISRSTTLGLACVMNSEISGSTIEIKDLLAHVNISLYNTVQSLPGAIDVVITVDKTYFIGETPIENFRATGSSVLTLMKCSSHDLSYLRSFKSAKIFKSSSGLESHKIICDRSEVMPIYEKLIRNSIIPVCLEEIHRLSIENSTYTIYDDITTGLYKTIERSINRDIIDKYNRTPPAKRQSYDLGLLYVTGDEALAGQMSVVYCMFRVVKGTTGRCDQIIRDGVCIGRVVRGGYRYSSGCCHGIGVLYPGVDLLAKCGSVDLSDKYESGDLSSKSEGVDLSARSKEKLSKLYCKAPAQSMQYEIEVTKIFTMS